MLLEISILHAARDVNSGRRRELASTASWASSGSSELAGMRRIGAWDPATPPQPGCVRDARPAETRSGWNGWMQRLVSRARERCQGAHLKRPRRQASGLRTKGGRSRGQPSARGAGPVFPGAHPCGVTNIWLTPAEAPVCRIAGLSCASPEACWCDCPAGGWVLTTVRRTVLVVVEDPRNLVGSAPPPWLPCRAPWEGSCGEIETHPRQPRNARAHPAQAGIRSRARERALKGYQRLRTDPVSLRRAPSGSRWRR